MLTWQDSNREVAQIFDGITERSLLGELAKLNRTKVFGKALYQPGRRESNQKKRPNCRDQKQIIAFLSYLNW